jgi:hypothetical protein
MAIPSLFRFDKGHEETKMAAFFHDGFGYTFHHENKDGSIYRKCKCHRSEKCNAALKCLVDGSIIASGVHGPGCFRKNGKTVVAHASGGDASAMMHQWVEERCLSQEHSHDSAKKVWNDCIAHFTEMFGDNFAGMSRDRVSNLVHNARNRAHGGNFIAKVEAQFSGSTNTAFLRDHRMFCDVKGPQRMFCYSTKELLSLLEYPKVCHTLMMCLMLYSNFSQLSGAVFIFYHHFFRFNFCLMQPFQLYLHLSSSALLQ